MFVDRVLRGHACAGNASELVFNDITADAMGLLLNWMYAGFKARLTLNQAVSLFKVSHRFNMGKLQHQCEQTIKASIGMEAYAQVENLAHCFHCVELKEVRSCHDATSSKSSLTSVHFHSFTAETVLDLIWCQH